MSTSDLAAAFANTLVPPRIDVFTALEYVPSERQSIFHELSNQRVNAILYGGSAGSGKSAALLMEAVDQAVNNPYMRIACIRRSYNELEESFIAELIKRDHAKAVGGVWNASKFTLRFSNGSLINFTYAENEIDASRIQGGEYQMLCIDEASLVLPTVIQHIEERMRSGKRGLPVLGIRLASNPGGVGHKYLKDRFIKPTDIGRVDPNTGLPCIRQDKNGRTLAYVPAKATDNPHIDAGYQSVLDAIEDPQRRKAMRDGDWDAQVGAFFPQMSRTRHVVPEFEIPESWQRYCGVDYGYAAPWGVIWCAVDNDGRLWAYREIYATKVDAKDQGIAILAAEEQAKEYSVIRVADPSMWGHRGTPLTIADIYGLEGCGLMQADNDRLNGWSRVHFYLNDGVACEYHREQELETCPRLHILEGHCPMLLETMLALPRSDTRPDDAETRNVDDHLSDALRYLCMAVGSHAGPVFDDDYQATPSDKRRLEEEHQAAYNVNQQGLVAGRFGGSLSMNP